MNETIVIYKSKYGNSKKYAEWISETLACDIADETKIKVADLKDYKNIIFGGGIYAGAISGIKTIVKNYSQLNDKNIVVYTCGIADPSKEENIKAIQTSLDKEFSKEMGENIKVFHFRGALEYSKLGFMHRQMMSMLIKMLKKKDSEILTEEDKQMIENFGKDVDYKTKETILPLVEYVKQLNNK